MNLVNASWLPFRRVDGRQELLPLSSIVDPSVVDFALPRADFQGAAYQLVIGLLQTVFAPETADDWHEAYDEPPTKGEMQLALDRVTHAFNVTGDGPLFMQDFDNLESAKSTHVSGLLIEAPGENTLKKNTDHFIKRGLSEHVSLEIAVLALFTLQINAPTGGQGHRTGLRGGGPLTTLIMPQSQESTLWQKLWLNVIHRDKWRYDDPDLHSNLLFPWLAPTKTSEKKGSETYATDVHPLHMFWAMPRRIRLIVEEKKAVCQLSGHISQQTVHMYRTKNYGYNYSGTWSHPLTPYRFNPKKPDEERLSGKGQQGGITYKTWDALTLQSESDGQIPALVVRTFSDIHGDFITRQSEIPRLWVFGYDMDNMKARGWYSVEMPLFAVSPEKQESLLHEVKLMQTLATDTLWQCRTQIKSAWFERPKEAKGDFSCIDLSFWQRTESMFFQAVSQLAETASVKEPQLAPEQAKAWLQKLRLTASDLFDEFVLTELHGDRAMAKKIKAKQMLTGWLYGGKSIKTFQQANNIEPFKEVV